MHRILLLAFIIFSGCEDYKYLNSTLKKIIKMGENRYHLQCFGRGFSAPEKIEDFRLTFITRDHYDISSARKLMVDFIEDYIVLINNIPEILQYFDKLPINERHIYLQISFEDNDGKYVTELPGILIYEGTITFLKLSESGGFDDNFSETYAEAYFKVYGTQPPERN